MTILVSRRVRAILRPIPPLLFALLIAAPCHAGIQEGLAAYDKADFATALKLLKPLAEQGDVRAQNTLGRMYSLGQGGPRDARGAAEWFLKAARQGSAEAQGMLGYAYLVGDGAPQNNDKAYEWTRKAAEQGNVVAQYNLAVMHSSSVGIRKDPTEFVKWMRKAAEQGHGIALNALATMHWHGSEGVKKNPVLAYMLFTLAASKGVPSASGNRKQLETTLPTSQIEKGKHLAATWKPGLPLPTGMRWSRISPLENRLAG